MLISHEKKFIFIHVGKTGGSNIEAALAHLCHRPAQTPISRLRSKLGWVGHRGRVFPQHTTALEAKRALPDSIFDAYFKFALVRNPWDWLTSLYFYIARTQSHRHSARVRGMEFPQYVDFEIRRNRRHQHLFLLDEQGTLLVDHVGRFERLHEVFDEHCERFQVAGTTLGRAGVHERPPYQSLYTDDLQRVVAQHWAQDIRVFDYTFD